MTVPVKLYLEWIALTYRVLIMLNFGGQNLAVNENDSGI